MTDKVLSIQERAEAEMNAIVAEELKKHPAYSWFSRVQGIGNENIAKVVGMLDISRAPFISSFWKYAGMHVVNVEVMPEQQVAEVEKSIIGLAAKLEALKKKMAAGKEETAAVMTVSTVGTLVDRLSQRLDQPFEVEKRGFAPRRIAGGPKLQYNKELRTMCFRLAGSILKSGIRYYCMRCNEQRPPAKIEDPVCEKCGGKEFGPKPISKFAAFYMREKAKLVSKYQSHGMIIVPTMELPKDDQGRIFEPIGTISEGHVHMQAQRKMIKLFLACLHIVWREAEGLPPTKPYAFGILGHDPVSYIKPEDMLDKPERKKKRQATV